MVVVAAALVALLADLPFRLLAARVLQVALVRGAAAVVPTVAAQVQARRPARLVRLAVVRVVQAAPQAHGRQAQTERNGPRLTEQAAVAADHLPATQVLGALMGAVGAAWRRLARSVLVLRA